MNLSKLIVLKLLQAWVLTCIFFVFGALLEYSLILLHLKIYSVMQGIPENVTTSNLGRSLIMATTGVEPPPLPTATNGSRIPADVARAKMMRKNKMVAKFDIVCLICFPIVFLIFGFVYILSLSI